MNRMTEKLKLLDDKLEETKYQRKKKLRQIECAEYTEGVQPYLSSKMYFWSALSKGKRRKE